MKVKCSCCKLEAVTFGLYDKDGLTIRSGSIYAYCLNHVRYLDPSCEIEITKEDYLARLAMKEL